MPQRQRAPDAVPSPLCPAGTSVDQRSHVDLVGWVNGFPARALGGRFEGRNRRVENGVPREWIRPCDVVAYDPARLFAYTVGDRFDATPATRWSYLITPTNEGCPVRQEFEHLPDGLSGLRLRAEELDDAEVITAVRREEIRAGMTLTLERMRIELAG